MSRDASPPKPDSAATSAAGKAQERREGRDRRDTDRRADEMRWAGVGEIQPERRTGPRRTAPRRS